MISIIGLFFAVKLLIISLQDDPFNFKTFFKNNN